MLPLTSRRARRGFVVLVVTAVLLLVAWAAPIRARMTAVATVADGLGISEWRPFAPPVAEGERSVAGAPADVYEGGGSAPVVVLVPGAAPAGREDARVRRLARVLARAERRVVVPELQVYDEQLVEADVEHLIEVTRSLSADGAEVVLVGISFGGSLALVAAADPRLDGRVAGVATFGAYADLVGVVQAATTGVSRVGDRVVRWDGDPRAEGIVQEQLTALLPPRSGRDVRAALDGDPPQRPLTPDARAVYELLVNEDPRHTYRLARGLPPHAREPLAAVSPVSVAEGLSDVPIMAMHSRTDPVIPYGELLRLAAEIPNAEVLTVDSMGHAELRVTDPGGWFDAIDDLWTLWRFTSWIIDRQEPTWPWGPG